MLFRSPTTGKAIPPLTHTPYYSAATAASHHSRTSEPSYSPPRGHPLMCLRRLRVVPFLGLAIVHRVGSLGVVWSTLSTNDNHRKRHERGVADSRDPHGPWPHASKSLLFMRKLMISPPDRFEPPATCSHAGKCFLYYVEKSHLSLKAETH